MKAQPDLDDGFGHWFAGFVAGEGSFLIYRHGRGGRSGSPSYLCGCRIGLRADDAGILHEIVDRTGVGVVRVYERKVTKHAPYAEWRTRSRNECVALVHILDRYPLRAKKAADYVIWREAVRYWAGMSRPSRSSRLVHHRHWEHMEHLMLQLHTIREYRSQGTLRLGRPDPQLRLLDGGVLP